MHFTVNSYNIIENFHIEEWDRLALGNDLSILIESFIGKSREDFILFTLQKQLFLKIRILCSLGAESIYYWACAPIHNENIQAIQRAVQIGVPIDKMKYAKFYIKTPGIENKVSIFYEGRLASEFDKNGYGFEEFWFDLPAEKHIDISINFNISRNSDNAIYFIAEKSSKVETISRSCSSDISVVAIDKLSTEMIILEPKEVEESSDEELKKFSNFMITNPQDEEQLKKAKKIKIRLSNLKPKWWQKMLGRK